MRAQIRAGRTIAPPSYGGVAKLSAEHITATEAIGDDNPKPAALCSTGDSRPRTGARTEPLTSSLLCPQWSLREHCVPAPLGETAETAPRSQGGAEYVDDRRLEE